MISLFIDAIYCYTTDVLGPCYAIDGEKIMLQWFRSYLVIVAKESKQKSQNSTTPPIGNYFFLNGYLFMYFHNSRCIER
ncbi:vacuolar protein sorting-associated protein 11 homolog isoform X4 [Lycorma delicatula]|uniref:vacuolar protein sorting-associated protein 11 homolog isoform X4 n=1 Tax=Lycorma delicatula TaxID=130591 RepID=UPI003F517496